MVLDSHSFQNISQQTTVNDMVHKYLTFSIGQEIFGITILRVQEIISMMEITRVPWVPKHVIGLMNLRGMIIPVLNLRIMLGLNPLSATNITSILNLQIDSDEGYTNVGLLVDDLPEITVIPPEMIHSTPEFGTNSPIQLTGIGRVGKKNINLLVVEKIITHDTFQLPDLPF